MSLPRSPLPRRWPSLQAFTSHVIRRSIISHVKPPFPTIETCPSPTCQCATTPALPDGLPIDREKSLNGTMAAYAEQVLVCTGKDDWSSRIEEENEGDNLVADVKELVGRGGKFADPYHNILTTNSSFPSTPSPSSRPDIQNTSAYLFPTFKYVPYLPRLSFSSVEALVQGYLLPKKLHPAHDVLSPIHRDRLLRQEEVQTVLHGVRDVKELVVLICGHGGRDQRCGIYGPVLRQEFERALEREGVVIEKDAVDVETPGQEEGKRRARVGLISHIGGHKFAGNVIIYVPPGWRGRNGKESELAGKGIWYGRVEPKHVEGIVRETVLGGRVVQDMFRGGVGSGGEILRM